MQVSTDRLASIDAELESLGKSEPEIAAILDRVARAERLALADVDEALSGLGTGSTPAVNGRSSAPTRSSAALKSKHHKQKKQKKQKRSDAPASPTEVAAAPPVRADVAPETTTDRGRSAAELLAEAMGDSEFPPPLDDNEIADLLAEPHVSNPTSSDPAGVSAAEQMARAVEAVGDLEAALFDDPPTLDEPLDEPLVDVVGDGVPNVEAQFFGDDDVFDGAAAGAAPLADLEASPNTRYIEDELFGEEEDEPEEGTAIFSVNDIDAIVEDARKSSLPPLHPEISTGPDDLDGALDGMRAEGSLMESPFDDYKHPPFGEEEHTAMAERVSASEFELLVDDEIMMLDEDELFDEGENEAVIVSSSRFPPPAAASPSQIPPPADAAGVDDDEAGKKKGGFFKKLFGGD